MSPTCANQRSSLLACWRSPEAGRQRSLLREGVPALSFESSSEVRGWLEKHSATSDGVWLRIYKSASGLKGVSTTDEFRAVGRLECPDGAGLTVGGVSCFVLEDEEMNKACGESSLGHATRVTPLPTNEA